MYIYFEKSIVWRRSSELRKTFKLCIKSKNVVPLVSLIIQINRKECVTYAHRGVPLRRFPFLRS